ncbi:hypothetical protein TNCV_4861621 [Trichonephila clavipes]|nr:hypothetical protein TNCV_4861621 [Trichonephila clavipes]
MPLLSAAYRTVKNSGSPQLARDSILRGTSPIVMQPSNVIEAPSLWILKVGMVLDEKLSRRWIGRGGPIPWPLRFLEITSFNFLWEYMKNIAYQSPVAHIRGGHRGPDYPPQSPP